MRRRSATPPVRALLLAALPLATILLAPLATASQPEPPWRFEEPRVEGTGAVGDTLEVVVRVRANEALDATIVLKAPDWVIVEGEPWQARAQAGETVERAWHLVPTREGFWTAIAHSDPAGFGAACACAFGFAGGPPEATLASTAEAAVPVPVLERALTERREGDRAIIERAVVPVSSWLAHAQLRAWITSGAAQLCEECAVAAPDPAHEARGPGNATLVATAALPLAEAETYTLWDEVIVTFETPPDATLHPTAHLATGCENRRWGTEESWSCAQESRGWRAVPWPAAHALALVAGVALALGVAQRPPRGNRR